MDYAPIRAFLVGRCRKTIKEAALTSLEEFNLLAEGLTQEQQEIWERERWRVFMDWSISPNLKRRPRRPQDVIRFPWEEGKAAEATNYEPLTEAEIDKISKIFNIERKHISNG
jgi:hypothetical protein